MLLWQVTLQVLVGFASHTSELSWRPELTLLLFVPIAVAGSHDQAKRALVRAMDREVCLDTKVSELSNMLDMLTRQQAGSNNASGAVASAPAPLGGPTAVAEAAGAAAVVAIVDPKQLQQMAETGMQQPHGAEQLADNVANTAAGSMQDTAGDAQGSGQQDGVAVLEQKVDTEVPEASGAGVDQKQQGQQQQWQPGNSSAAYPEATTASAEAGTAAGVDAPVQELSSTVDAHSISISSCEYDSTLSRSTSKSADLQQDSAADKPCSVVAMAGSQPADAAKS